MSELLRIYNTTNKLRPSDARVIPGQKVNYFDRENAFSVNFETFREPKVTSFTDRSLNYYDEEYGTMVLPQSWRPVEEGITLNRWLPNKPFYVPGQSQG